MTLVETGIIKAIIYSDLFDFPLTDAEIFKWFLGNRQVDAAKLKKFLSNLVEQNLVDQNGKYYFLPGKNQLYDLRKSRLRSSTKKYLLAERMAKKLAMIPWVMGIFLTGTVAVDNAGVGDDIDLMIVTKTNRLWSTRLLVTGMLEMMGMRRKPGQEEVEDSFCVNLYLDEAAMAVPAELRNLYSAHEVVQAKIVYEKEGVAARFIKENRWVREYLPNTNIPTMKNTELKKIGENWIEKVSFKLQKMYMLKKITRERVTKQSAYFHPKDIAKQVLSKYDRALRAYGIK